MAATDSKEFMPSTGNLSKACVPGGHRASGETYYSCLVKRGRQTTTYFGYTHRLVLPSPIVREALFSNGQWLVVKMLRTSCYRGLSLKWDIYINSCLSKLKKHWGRGAGNR